MKRFFALFMAVIVTMSLTACEMRENSTRDETLYQEELMKQATDEIGTPNITEFYEKKMAKEIFEKRDDSSLICYVYNQNLDGQYIYVGKSMGYGLP